MNPLAETIQAASARIAEHLNQHHTATAWQLKIMFRLSASVLYLALGSLYQEGKLTLQANGLDYSVTWGSAQTNGPAAPPPSMPESM